MPIRGVRIAAGRASGPVHLVDDPLDWTRGVSEGDAVLALSALWWPPLDGGPDRARGFVLQGVPPPTPAPTSAPVVADVDLDLLREGEVVDVDGNEGSVRIAGVREVEVVTSILEREDGRILLLERSDRVGSFRGRWAGVSGFLEDPTPLAQATREVHEETGLAPDDLSLAAEGAPVYSRDEATVYVVHPFRFRVARTDVALDWEHRRAEWVEPAEIRRRPTVPKLDRVWEHVAPPGRPKR